MKIRIARQNDIAYLLQYDAHVAPEELQSALALGRVLVAEIDGAFAGWLRWNLFWDNTPFLNLLYFLEPYRGRGYGKEMVLHWEQMLQARGYGLVMTSTLSSEQAQHFYRKLNYVDAGCLLLKNEPLEIIFAKELNAT